MRRPDFLRLHLSCTLQETPANGRTIVEDFSALSDCEARVVDKWLLINFVYGSLTWQECILFDWLNNEDRDGLRWETL